MVDILNANIWCQCQFWGTDNRSNSSNAESTEVILRQRSHRSEKECSTCSKIKCLNWFLIKGFLMKTHYSAFRDWLNCKKDIGDCKIFVSWKRCWVMMNVVCFIAGNNGPYIQGSKWRGCSKSSHYARVVQIELWAKTGQIWGRIL